MSDVPEGTITEVLDWVGDDPERARAALDAEYASSNPRSTLITQLEAKEAPETEAEPEPDSEADSEAEADTEDEPEVNTFNVPADVNIDLSDASVFVGKMHVRDETVVVPDGVELKPSPGQSWPIVGSQTEYFQVVGATNGVALVIGGDGHFFNQQQTIALMGALTRASTGL